MTMPSVGGQRKVAVVGLGSFGRSLALALQERGCRVLGIDSDALRVQRLADNFRCVLLDATDEEALRDTGVAEYETVVVTVESDFESNLMAVAALKTLGVPHVVSVSGADYTREILLRVGVDRVLDPQSDAAQRVATELIYPGFEELVPLGPAHHVATLQTPSSLVGRFVSDLAQLIERQEVIVLAIQRGPDSLVLPAGDTELLNDDLLVILANDEAVANLSSLS